MKKLIEEYIREKLEKKGKDIELCNWLDSAAKRASQISLATHVLKFTHGDAKGSNINATMLQKDETPSGYVSTSDLSDLLLDVTGGGALDVAGLLQLKTDDGVILLDYIKNNDSTPFVTFTSNQEQLQAWMNGFQAVLTDSELSSHTLAKQVYFPVEEGEYHLLSPLFSSSLAQALYDRIHNERFGEKAKETRKKRRKKYYCEHYVIDYPDLAIQKFGGTKPQNISKQNIKRGGKAYLLRSLPPLWVSIKKPPLSEFGFWRALGGRIGKLIKDFQSYLLSVQARSSNKEIRDERKDYIDGILDAFICLAEEIKNLPESGWSMESKIPAYEKLWLDCAFKDADFQEKRLSGEWMHDVAKHFSRWLKSKLQTKKLEFGDDELLHLTSCCMDVLKETN